MLVRALLLLAALLAPATALAQSTTPPTCQPVAFTTGVAPGDLLRYRTVGTLCWRGAVTGKTLQVLLHGAATSHIYWSIPSPGASYVDAATDAGYVTLNLDRLGAGASDHPLSALVTTTSSAYVVHEIVAQLRAGITVPTVSGATAFSRIELVGHSLGSFVSVVEAAVYRDVDAVQLTGFTHTAGVDVAQLPLWLEPAALDPEFAGYPWAIDVGYVTTRPGAVGALLVYDDPAAPGTYADPAVVAFFEAHRDVATAEELGDFPVVRQLSPLVGVPAQVVDGQFDAVLCLPPSCDLTLSLEPLAFGAAACVETAEVPNAGHAFNLQRNAPSAYATMLAWSQRRAPASLATTPQACP